MDWRISPCVIRCTKADTSDNEKGSRAEERRQRETAKRSREGDEGVASPARNRDRRKELCEEKQRRAVLSKEMSGKSLDLCPRTSPNQTFGVGSFHWHEEEASSSRQRL